MLARVVVALLALSLANPLLAQGKERPRIAVRCVDTAGKPVAGAEVRVLQHRQTPDAKTDYTVSGPYRTDDNGIATTTVALDYDGGRFDRWFVARVPGHLVGTLRQARFDANSAAAVGEAVVRLEPSRDLRGIVQVPPNHRAADARVRTLTVIAADAHGDFTGFYPRNSEFMRDTLPEWFDAAVAESGEFVLHDMPAAALIYLAAEGSGLGQAQWSNARLPDRGIPDRIDLAMEVEAVLAGTVTSPRGAPLPDAELDLRIVQARREANVTCAFAARSDATGRFRIAGLPAGMFRLSATHAAGVTAPLRIDLFAGQEVADRGVQLEEGVQVRGIVRGRRDRVAVERVGISAITDDKLNWPLAFTSTDPQGRFVLRLPKGRALLHVNGVPQAYQQPPTTLDKLLRIDADPDDESLSRLVFELEPAPAPAK